MKNSRTIAIGDIHGCSPALDHLLNAVELCPTDTVVTLGDYIDRGPDSRGVLECMIGLKRRCQHVPLVGNHEIILLKLLDTGQGGPFWLSVGGKEMLDSYGIRALPADIPDAHIEFLRQCRRYHETQTHIFVHAGYYPSLEMDEQPDSALLWEDLQATAVEAHCSGKTAIVGHTPQMDGDILDLGFIVGIDTWCHGGGWLTGLDVDSGFYWQASERGKVRTGKRWNFEAPIVDGLPER